MQGRILDCCLSNFEVEWMLRSIGHLLVDRTNFVAYAISAVSAKKTRLLIKHGFSHAYGSTRWTVNMIYFFHLALLTVL